jgi:hypothetical protein
MHARRLTLQQIHSLSPAQRAERVAELLASAVARRLHRQKVESANIKVETSATATQGAIILSSTAIGEEIDERRSA